MYTNGKINIFEYECPKDFWKGFTKVEKTDRKSYMKVLYEDMKNKNILLKYNIHNFNEFKHWYGMNHVNVNTDIETCKINDRIIKQKGLFCKEKTDKIYSNIKEIQNLYKEMKNCGEIKNNGDRNIFSKFRKWANQCYGLQGYITLKLQSSQLINNYEINYSDKELNYKLVFVIKVNGLDYKGEIINNDKSIFLDFSNYKIGDFVEIRFCRLTPNLIKLI